jgi:outer membrane protein OmpA-like peptidoglycan-associated protein
VLTVTGLTILVGTPFLIRYLAVDWLRTHGGETVHFEDVDFNPFTATLLLKQLDVSVDEQTTLSFDSVGADLAWMPLLRKQVAVETVYLNGFSIVIDRRQPDAPVFGGIRLPAGEEEPTPDAEAGNWAAGISTVALSDVRLRYLDSQLDLALTIDELTLSSLYQWSAEEPASVEARGALNQAPFQLSGEVAPFASAPRYALNVDVAALQLAAFEHLLKDRLDRLSGQFSFDGNVRFEQNGDDFSVHQDGDIRLQNLNAALVEPAASLASQDLSVNSTLSFDTQGANQDLQLDADIRLQGLDAQATQPPVRVSNRDAALKSKLTLKKLGEDQDLQLEADLRLQGLDAIATQPPVHVSNQDATFKNTLKLKTAGEDQALKLAGDIRLDGLAVIAEQSRLQLLQTGSLTVTGLDLAGPEQLSIEAVQADQLAIGRSADNTEADASIEAGRFRVESLTMADRLLTIDSIVYTDGQSRVRRDAQGNWRMVGIIKAMNELAGQSDDDAAPTDEPAAADPAAAPPAATAPAAESTAEPEPFAAVLNRIEVDGDSSIDFLDEYVKPPYHALVKLETLRIESLDTRKPDQNSPLEFKAGLDKHTRLSLSGNLQPFASPVGVDIQSNIQALDMPPLSPYTRDSMGLVLDSGNLDMDTKFAMDKERMEGLIKLKLHQLELDTVESENSLQSKIPVPLNVALDTLRDSNNTISLKIPVKGDPANPSFNINDALTTALASGVKKGALTYLTFALQPYGAVIAAAKYAGEAATKVRLKPVEFKPGQTDIDAMDKDYLSKIAKLLGERPKLNIKVCGVAVPQDTVWLREQAAAEAKADSKSADGKKTPPVEIDVSQLQALAQARADAVRDYMVATFKTPASRLVGCRPRNETGDDKATPRTDLLI